LPDAVPLPKTKSRGFESLEERRQPPGHAMVNPQFVDHSRLLISWPIWLISREMLGAVR
jgi:hypothetical protein